MPCRAPGNESAEWTQLITRKEEWLCVVILEQIGESGSVSQRRELTWRWDRHEYTQ